MTDTPVTLTDAEISALSGTPMTSPQHLDEVETIVIRDCRSGLGIKVIGGLNEDSSGRDYGIHVKRVIPGGRAAELGRIREGDQLTSVNGNSLLAVTNDHAVNLLRQAASTNQVTLTVSRSAGIRRHYKELLESKLGEKTSSLPISPKQRTIPESSSDDEGVSYSSRDAATPSNPSSVSSHHGGDKRGKTVQRVILRKSTGLGVSIVGGTDRPEGPGIFIAEVARGGDCFQDGSIKPGDQLIGINGQPLVGVTHETAKSILTVISLSPSIQTVEIHFVSGMKSLPDWNTSRSSVTSADSFHPNVGSPLTDSYHTSSKRSPPFNQHSPQSIVSPSSNDPRSSSYAPSTPSPMHARHPPEVPKATQGMSPSLPTLKPNTYASMPTGLGDAGVKTLGAGDMAATFPRTGVQIDHQVLSSLDRSPGDGGSLEAVGTLKAKSPTPDVGTKENAEDVLRGTTTMLNTPASNFPAVQTSITRVQLPSSPLPPFTSSLPPHLSALPLHMQRLGAMKPQMHSTPQDKAPPVVHQHGPDLPLYSPDPSPVLPHQTSHSPKTSPTPQASLTPHQLSMLHSNQSGVSDVSMGGRRMSLDPGMKLKVEKLEVALEYLGLQLSDEQKTNLRNQLPVDQDGMVRYGDFVSQAKAMFQMQLKNSRLMSPSFHTVSHDAPDSASPPSSIPKLPQIPNTVTVPFDELNRLRLERDSAVAEVTKLQNILQDREKSFSRKEEELLRIRKDAQGAIHESRALKSRVHLAEAAQKEARNMEMDYEEVVRLLEREISELRTKLKERPHAKPSQNTDELQKRLATIGCELRKAETSKKTFEVATERLLQFAEFVHDYSTGGLQSARPNGQSSRRGEGDVYYPPSYLAKHKKGQVDLAAEAKDTVKAVKALIDIEPLPYGWEETYTKDGVRFFTNHVTQSTSWVHPVSNIDHSPVGRIKDLPETVT